jgi:hypothetical protein
MAHFYGELQGNRGVASRTGSASSGMNAHIRGWNNGVKVELFNEDGEDHIKIYLTGGSRNEKNKELIYDSYQLKKAEHIQKSAKELIKTLKTLSNE